MRRPAAVVVLAGILLAPAARAQTETTRQKIGQKMVQVRDLYYEDQMPTALDVLGEIKGLLEALPDAKPNEKAGVQLWRAAVYVALGDQPRARAEATTALSFDPSLIVDLAVFPPSVKTLVDSIRAAGPITPAPTPLVIGSRPLPTPRDPAVAPRSLRPPPPPLVKRPLFWAVAAGLAAAAAAGVLAANASSGSASPGETDTTITVGR